PHSPSTTLFRSRETSQSLRRLKLCDSVCRHRREKQVEHTRHEEVDCDRNDEFFRPQARRHEELKSLKKLRAKSGRTSADRPLKKLCSVVDTTFSLKHCPSPAVSQSLEAILKCEV